MHKTTKNMIQMALDSDNTVASRTREIIETALRDKNVSEPSMFLKQSEVACMLSLSRQSIRNLVVAGKLRPVTISKGIVRYRREDVLSLGA